MPTSRQGDTGFPGGKDIPDRRVNIHDRRQGERRSQRERRRDYRLTGEKPHRSVRILVRSLVRGRLGVDRRKGIDRRKQGNRRHPTPQSILTPEELKDLLE